MDRMLDDRTREEGIKDLHQRVTTTAKGGIYDLTKGAQALKGFCFHTLSMPKRAFRVSSPSPPPCCWLNGKLRAFPITTLREAKRSENRAVGRPSGKGIPREQTSCCS